MYSQVAIDTTAYFDLADDTEFFTELFNEQSVSCLPASVSEHTVVTFLYLHVLSSFLCDKGVRYRQLFPSGPDNAT